MSALEPKNAAWRKSTRSGTNGDCVEVSTDADGHVLVRDTKNRDRGTLRFTPAEWTAFIGGARDGEFDL